MCSRLLVTSLLLFVGATSYGQGHWFSAWGGASMDYYSGKRHVGNYNATPRGNFGLRYGRDLGPRFRFGLDASHSRRGFEEISAYYLSPTEIGSMSREYAISEWTVSLSGAMRILNSKHGEMRALFGFDMVLPYDGEVMIKAPLDALSGEFEINAPQAIGPRTGVRYAHMLKGMLWLFTELDISRIYAFGNAETTLPDEAGYVDLSVPRTAFLLCIGLEFGRRDDQE